MTQESTQIELVLEMTKFNGNLTNKIKISRLDLDQRGLSALSYAEYERDKLLIAIQ